MARGVNKVILIGNLGNDPEVRYTPGGSAVANFPLATSEAWRDKQSGDLQERTEWHRVVCFNRLAEIVGEYLHKGSKIYIEGSLRTRKWQGKDGLERYTTEIIANEMHMLDKRGGEGNYEKPIHAEHEQPTHLETQSEAEISASPGVSENIAAEEDDIPF